MRVSFLDLRALFSVDFSRTGSVQVSGGLFAPAVGLAVGSLSVAGKALSRTFGFDRLSLASLLLANVIRELCERTGLQFAQNWTKFLYTQWSFRHLSRFGNLPLRIERALYLVLHKNMSIKTKWHQLWWLFDK